MGVGTQSQMKGGVEGILYPPHSHQPSFPKYEKKFQKKKNYWKVFQKLSYSFLNACILSDLRRITYKYDSIVVLTKIIIYLHMSKKSCTFAVGNVLLVSLLIFFIVMTVGCWEALYCCYVPIRKTFICLRMSEKSSNFAPEINITPVDETKEASFFIILPETKNRKPMENKTFQLGTETWTAIYKPQVIIKGKYMKAARVPSRKEIWLSRFDGHWNEVEESTLKLTFQKAILPLAMKLAEDKYGKEAVEQATKQMKEN